MTKFTDLATLDKLCGIMGLMVHEGRPQKAPQIDKDAEMETEDFVGTVLDSEDFVL